MTTDFKNLYRKAKGIIPGGSQLFSKKPELFAPNVWPTYYKKAKGVLIWGLDGKQWIDMSIFNVGACILGYADDDVDNSVIACIKNGSASSLNCPEEIELAELLIEIHPWAEMVRYCRSGGEAMSIAVRIARAATGREKVLFSGYHGWCDWYLAANLGKGNSLDSHLMPGLHPSGVPQSLQSTAIPFTPNSINKLSDQIESYKEEIAAIVIEPARSEEADSDYLKSLKILAERIGAVLIFDEITSAFRMNPGGIHLRYKVNPHISVMSKSMANGYAMAAIIGESRVMKYAQKSFISSTNWSERIGPTAAISTIKKYIRTNTAQHIINMGETVKSIWRDAALRSKLDIKISGLPTLPNFSFNSNDNLCKQTAFTTLMLEKGFLAYRQFKPSFSHNKEHLERYEEAVEYVFNKLSKDEPRKFLKGQIAETSFARLTRE